MVVQNTNSSAQHDALLMSMIEEMSNQLAKFTEVDKMNKTVNESLTAELEKYKEQIKLNLKQKRINIIDLEKEKKALDNVVYKMVPSLYCGNTIVKPHNVLSVIDTEETLKLAEESRLKTHAKQNDPIAKEKKVNIAPIDYAFWLPILKPVSKIPPVQSEPVSKEIPRELPDISLVKDSFNKMRSHVNDFENLVSVRTKVTGPNEGSWGFEHIQKAFKKDVKPFVNILKEYFHMFDQGLQKEITDMKEFFTHMETEVAKCFVERKTFKIKEKELIIENARLLEHIISELLKKENDRLLELIISQDLVHTVVNSLAEIDDYQNMENSILMNMLIEQTRELRPLDSDLDLAYLGMIMLKQSEVVGTKKSLHFTMCSLVDSRESLAWRRGTDSTQLYNVLEQIPWTNVDYDIMAYTALTEYMFSVDSVDQLIFKTFIVTMKYPEVGMIMKFREGWVVGDGWVSGGGGGEGWWVLGVRKEGGVLGGELG
ncbi:hypothetical protein Tco_0923388 [Tanacetum coccineum]|uniref:Uncharacterized protein n=1 Tax=Tanacetum coccineum TaxID=301880 RepID=A0ABQ5D798_9ASTR